MQVLHVVGQEEGSRIGGEPSRWRWSWPPKPTDSGHTDDLMAVGPGHEATGVRELPADLVAPPRAGHARQHAGVALRRVLLAPTTSSSPTESAAAGRRVANAAPATPVRGVADHPRHGRSLVPRSRQVLLARAVCRQVDAVVALTPEMGDEARRLRFDGPVWPLPNARSTARFREGLDRAEAALTLCRSSASPGFRAHRRLRGVPRRPEASEARSCPPRSTTPRRRTWSSWGPDRSRGRRVAAGRAVGGRRPGAPPRSSS